MIRKAFSLTYKMILNIGDVPYSTFMRWKERFDRNEPVIEKRGPKKVKPLELLDLMDQIRELSHKNKRTHDTGALYNKFKDSISRRELNEMVKAVREELKNEAAMKKQHIEWHKPGIVWAADDTEYGKSDDGGKLYIHNTRDLASRYTLPPIGGDFASGKTVANHLSNLFKDYGHPLFYKRDNHKNLNNHEVDKVLSMHMVIPLNSPFYYAPYNGAVEKAQQEVKDRIGIKQGEKVSIPRDHFQAYAESSTHDVNHKPRRILKGHTPCSVFFSEKGGVRFTKRRRREIFEWIKSLSCEIIEKLGNYSKKAINLSWRIAVETWLKKNGIITVTRKKKVLPTFL